MKTNYVLLLALLFAGSATAQELTSAKAELMGRVEDFFMHNFRDITARSSLQWSDVTNTPAGARCIRYQYEARIWDKKTIVANQVFTFDKDGKFVGFENIAGYPKDKPVRVVDTKTKVGLQALVEDFFKDNFRDVTRRETLEWGDLEKDPKGNPAIRYKYRAKIWDKETKIMCQTFTFTPTGEFVSVKPVEGYPKDVE